MSFLLNQDSNVLRKLQAPIIHPFIKSIANSLISQINPKSAQLLRCADMRMKVEISCFTFTIFLMMSYFSNCARKMQFVCSKMRSVLIGKKKTILALVFCYLKNFNINSFNVIILTFVLYRLMGYRYLFILLSYSATALPGF